MKFVFTDKKVNLPGKVHAYAEKKVGKLERYFKADTEAAIVFSIEKDRNNVELTIRSGGTVIRGKLKIVALPGLLVLLVHVLVTPVNRGIAILACIPLCMVCARFLYRKGWIRVQHLRGTTSPENARQETEAAAAAAADSGKE